MTFRHITRFIEADFAKVSRKRWNAGESNDERLIVNHYELGFSGIFRELGQFCKGLTGRNRIAKRIGVCRGSVFRIGSPADAAEDRDQKPSTGTQ